MFHATAPADLHVASGLADQAQQIMGMALEAAPRGRRLDVRAMRRVLRVHFSGFYAWLKEPLSLRGRSDARQTALIRQAWFDSGKVYGHRKLADDLRDQGEQVSENRVARLASRAGILAQVGYKHRPGRYEASLSWSRPTPWTGSSRLMRPTRSG